MKKIVVVLLILSLSILSLSLTACNQTPLTAEAMLPHCNDSALNSQLSSVNAISINADIYAVAVHSVQGDSFTVDFVYNDNVTVTAQLQDSTLVINQETKSSTVAMFGKFYMVVGVPESFSGYNLFAKLNTGSLSVENSKADKVEVEVNTGTVSVDVQNASLVDVDVNTGATKLTGKATVVQVETNTGAIKVDVNAQTLELSTDTGAINFNVTNNTHIQLDSATGSIRGTIAEAKQLYTITVDVDTGSCNVSEQTGTGANTLDIDVSTGSVKITFEY